MTHGRPDMSEAVGRGGLGWIEGREAVRVSLREEVGGKGVEGNDA